MFVRSGGRRGQLSSFAWSTLAVHYLLHAGYVPNTHTAPSTTAITMLSEAPGAADGTTYAARLEAVAGGALGVLQGLFGYLAAALARAPANDEVGSRLTHHPLVSTPH